MSVIDNIRRKVLKDIKQKKGSTVSEFSAVEMSIPEIPKLVEKKGLDYILYGEDNLYPLQISDLKYGSPIHAAIVSTAADMITGDGFLLNGAKTADESLNIYNSLPKDTKEKYDRFIENPNSHLNINEIKEKLAFDFKEQGACSFEIIYSTDFETINTIKYVDVKNIRSGKIVNDVVKSYWYSRDWKNCKLAEYRPKEIQAADYKESKNKDSKTRELNQIVYIKRGSLEYYGEPDYSGALTWIQIDFQLGIFHLSNIENGMNPSMSLNFYKVPETEEEKQLILQNIKKQFVGPRKTGKHMVFFSDGKDLAPGINPIQTSNLDKQLLNLAELSDKKILTGHKLTSPLLAGISVSGQLGGNIEIEKSYKIYDSTRIAPYRNRLDLAFNKILAYNNLGITVKTNPFNPFV